AVANFCCALDRALDTIIIPRQALHQQEQISEDEEAIRQFMITYALNDCLAVTKLVHELRLRTNSTLPTSTSTNELEAISDDEFEFDYEPEPVTKWPVNEISYNIDVHEKN
ncbi:unnamed protein product, partial [Adineta steineri]